MRAVLSLHPLRPQFFEELIVPLAAGRKVNPESYLERCERMRIASCRAGAYKRALHDALRRLEPPPLPTEEKLWSRVRARLERLDHRPDRLALAVGEKIDRDLHLHGRPFLVTEGSSDRVAARVDEYLETGAAPALDPLILEQLVRLDARIGRELRVDEPPPVAHDLAYRNEVLAELRGIHDLAAAAREGRPWARDVEVPRPATQVLAEELPWRAARLHARAYPAWFAEDVDGLETVCHAAGVEPPSCLRSARALFAEIGEAFPALVERLAPALDGDRRVGGYVGPADVAELLGFLATSGARIIQAASRHGEGAACSTLLRKMRECASYARKHGAGYLEATGVLPSDWDLDGDGDAR